MSNGPDDALDALRDADRRPRPLTDGARTRVERRMLAAFAEADRADASAPGSTTTVIDLGPTERDGHQARSLPRGRRLLVAAAAIVALAMAATIGLVGDRGDSVNVAGVEDDKMNTQVVAAVRAWCPAGLSDLTAALGDLDGDATRRVALGEVAAAAEGLFDLLDELREPDGLHRLDEIGRIPGEAALRRDGAGLVEREDVETLTWQLQAELDLTSATADECRISP